MFTMRFPIAAITRASRRAALVVVGILGATTLPAIAQQDAYKPPPTPRLLPPQAPSLNPLDAEVDTFLRVRQAQAQFKEVPGQGLAVVVIDTGINPQHISFQGQILPGLNLSEEGGRDDTTDRDGHGSNVAGIIAAREVPPTEGMPTGIAPGAKIIPIKVFPGGRFDKINEALQWVLDNREAYKRDHDVTISVVNMSLGNDQNLKNLDGLNVAVLNAQRDLIAALRARDVVVTVAAGNGYAENDPEQGMGFPAICPETLSVGAVYDTDFGPRPNNQPLVTYVGGAQVFAARAGRCTVFTQRLSLEVGGPFRTDIFAPGFIVTSMGPVPPAGSSLDPARTRSTQDGTSQASPVTAGIVMLMQHHFRELKASEGNDPGLPSVDLIEESLRTIRIRPGEVGPQTIVVDTEDAIAQAMDNVVSSGASFIRLDAVDALATLGEKLGQPGGTDQLQNLELELLQAEPEDHPAILERANIQPRGEPDQ